MEEPTIRELSRFDSKTYVRLVTYLRQVYRIVPLCDIPNEDVPCLILRHDIDLSLESALKMAEIESDMGVRSTYFVLLSSGIYNSFDGKNVEMIRQISGLGHEIGLHYDVNQYERYGGDNDQSLEMELKALGLISGKRVRSISSHAPRRPSSFLNISNCISADDPRLREVYVHDSQRLWAIKSLTILLNDSPRRVQLAIHPCLWIPSVRRSHGQTKLDLALLDVLSLLNTLRTLAIRVIHSRESCEN